MTFKKYTINSSDLSSNPVVTNFKHPVNPNTVSTSTLDKIMSSKIVQDSQKCIPHFDFVLWKSQEDLYWELFELFSPECRTLSRFYFYEKISKSRICLKYNPLCTHSAIQFENMPIQSYRKVIINYKVRNIQTPKKFKEQLIKHKKSYLIVYIHTHCTHKKENSQTLRRKIVRKGHT